MTYRKIHICIIGALLSAMTSSVNPSTFAQETASCKPSSTIATGAAAAQRVAQKAQQAFGGEKFSRLDSIKITGTGTARSPLTDVEMGIQYRLIATGSQISLLMSTPVGLIQMIHDGRQQVTRLDDLHCAFGLGPQDAFSLWSLARQDRAGRRIEAVPGGKPAMFRITDETCRTVDFEVDPGTGLVKEFAYTWNGLENRWRLSEFKNIEGISIPQWMQVQIGSREGNYFVDMKAEQIELNVPIKPEMFKVLGN